MAGWLRKYFGIAPTNEPPAPNIAANIFRPGKLPPRRPTPDHERPAISSDPSRNGPAAAMREMRIKMLTTLPAQFGNYPTSEFPKVCGVLMDWPTGETIATVVAFCDGEASLYSTGTFGVMGGVGHESVRNAAKGCVRTAQKYFDDAAVTKEYPYPNEGRIKFYFVGYDQVRVIETDTESVRNEQDKFRELYFEAHRVMTELRLIVEGRQKRVR